MEAARRLLHSKMARPGTFAASIFLIIALSMAKASLLVGGDMSSLPLSIPCLSHSSGRSAKLTAEDLEWTSQLRLRGGSDTSQVSNFEEVGKAFVSHYYNIFDTNRANLQGLYQDVSMLTFEGEKIQGAAAIGQKLTSLPFQTVKHEVVTVDSQPTAGNGVLVFACGNLKVDGSENPMKFSQVFCLMPLQGVQGYFCYNDVFRLNYG